jgi:hypothetical protein
MENQKAGAFTYKEIAESVISVCTDMLGEDMGAERMRGYIKSNIDCMNEIIAMANREETAGDEEYGVKTFKRFEATIKVIGWDELDAENDRQEECLKYLGNHLAEESAEPYAVFSGKDFFAAVRL